MALVATSQTLGGVKSHSIGPLKVEYINFTVANGDTSGTITAANLHTVDYCFLHGVGLTSQPTISGNVVTLAFADPLATRAGQAILLGK